MEENGRILYSDLTLVELGDAGYSPSDVAERFRPFQQILEFIQSTDKQIGHARQIAKERGVPKGDALHALIARDEHAVFVTYDHHFRELRDIAAAKSPRELIF